ncbi:MAG: hypothetical protein ABS879_02735, partial [Eubacteriales bacterium]
HVCNPPEKTEPLHRIRRSYNTVRPVQRFFFLSTGSYETLCQMELFECFHNFHEEQRFAIACFPSGMREN